MDDAAEAKAYAEADFAAVNDAFVARLLQVAGPIDQARAVDMGAGPADIPIRLLRARPHWRVAAVDASGAMLAIARTAIDAAGLAGAITPVLADAKGTPLAAGAYDVIFSNSILHHITDTASFWAEVKRLGRRGAAVFLRDLARPFSAAAARAIVNRYAAGESALLQEEYYRSLLSAYTVDEVRVQLASAGLGGLNVQMITDRHLDVWGAMNL